MAAQIDDLSRSLMSVVRPSAVSAAGRLPVEMEDGHRTRTVQLRRGEALLDGPGAGPPSPGNPLGGLCHR